LAILLERDDLSFAQQIFRDKQVLDLVSITPCAKLTVD
jgi:hypothetical protein